jgi:hypothetical protein
MRMYSLSVLRMWFSYNTKDYLIRSINVGVFRSANHGQAVLIINTLIKLLKDVL